MLQVNLLPWRALRRQRRMRDWLRLFAVTPVLVITGTFLLVAFLMQERALRQLHLSALNSAAQTLVLRQQRVETAAVQLNALTEKRALSHQRLQRGRDDLQLLELLASRMPEDIWLNELTERQGMLTLKGEGRFYHQILALSDTLSASELLGHVRLSDVQQKPDGTLSFVMQTPLRAVSSPAAAEASQ